MLISNPVSCFPIQNLGFVKYITGQANMQSRKTNTAGTAMAIPLFDKIANKFEQILFLLLDLSRSMCFIHMLTYNSLVILLSMNIP